MITLKINGIEVSVKKGSTILEAAEKAGVFIPTLCHDNRIAPFGACRLCVVQNGNSPWLVPSCFTPAREGMNIVTESPAILESIRAQLQLILINHPLECPVCDKAGECVLQDLVIRYNITELPYQVEEKERYIDRESPLIERDMSRCISCGRCVRICGELEGKHELDFMNRGIRMFIGTDGQRPLDCDFCGLCVSTCPVGSLNDRLYKNTTRPWKLEKKATVCGHCGLGCPLLLNVEKNTIRRVTTPVYDNGRLGFACVRGRFGWKAYQNSDRLFVPHVKGQEVSWPEALDFTGRKLQALLADQGGKSLAVLSSDSLTTEEAEAWQHFCRFTLGSPHMGSFAAMGYRQIVEGLTEVLGPDWKAGTLEDFQHAEALLVIGGGAAELHPVLKQLINIYRRDESHELVVLSPWADYFTERATLAIGITPESQERCLTELADALADKAGGNFSDVSRFDLKTSSLAKLVSLLRSDKEITLVVVPDLFGNNDHLVRLAAVLHDRVKAVLPLGAQCNSRGSVMLAGLSGNLLPGGKPAGEKERGFAAVEDILQAIDRGEIKALYLLGDDPLETYPDPERIRALLGKLDLLIVQSPYNTKITSRADVVLPAATVSEKGGSMVSLFGMERNILPALVPCGKAKTDLAILQELTAVMGLESNLVSESSLSSAVLSPTGQAGRLALQPAPPVERTTEFPFIMLSVPSLFGDTIIARQSPELLERKKGIRIIMHADDFEEGLYENGEEVTLVTPYGSAPGTVGYSYTVRRKTLLVGNIAGDPAGLNLLKAGRGVAPVNLKRLKS